MEILIHLSDFVEEQQGDDTLSRAYVQVALMNGETIESHQAEQFPCFESQGDCLYCLEKDQQAKVVRHQLLLPSPYRKEVMQLIHAIPAAGHLGREKTLTWILARGPTETWQIAVPPVQNTSSLHVGQLKKPH